MPPIPTQNRRVVLAQRPNRGPITSKTFNLENSKIGELSDGQILVKVLYTSIVCLYFPLHYSGYSSAYLGSSLILSPEHGDTGAETLFCSEHPPEDLRSTRADNRIRP
jgi:hypothetical protein